jgi:hypothetical protein
MARLVAVVEDLESAEEEEHEQATRGLLESSSAGTRTPFALVGACGRRTTTGMIGIASSVALLVLFGRHIAQERAKRSVEAPGDAVSAFDGQWAMQGLQNALGGFIPNETKTELEQVMQEQGRYRQAVLNATSDGSADLGNLWNTTVHNGPDVGSLWNVSLHGPDVGKMLNESENVWNSTVGTPLQNAGETLVQETLNHTLKEGLDRGLDFVGCVANHTEDFGLNFSHEGMGIQLQHALGSWGAGVGDLRQRAQQLRQEISSISTGEAAGGSPSCSLDGLYFRKVLHSNLGGWGPDTGETSLSLESNRTLDGENVSHLEFRVTANSPYRPGLPSFNGISYGLVGRYATVVVMPGTSVNLTFKVFNMRTNTPIHMPSVSFTFFDLDEYKGHTASEMIIARDFAYAELTVDTEISQTVNSDGTTTFQASTPGTFEDNPVDPLLLTEQQRNRAVTLTYTDTDEISVRLGATPGSSAARAFTFVAHPVLQCAKTIETMHRTPLAAKTHQEPTGIDAGFILWFLRTHTLQILGGVLIAVLLLCLAALVCC